MGFFHLTAGGAFAKICLMKLATTPIEQRRWMTQWRQAGAALEEFRRFELRTLTEADAWRQIEAVLSLAGHYPRPTDASGLVAQQAWFRRLHLHE
jgi:hypothetical protein